MDVRHNTIVATDIRPIGGIQSTSICHFSGRASAISRGVGDRQYQERKFLQVGLVDDS